jgi:hypothetical protein
MNQFQAWDRNEPWWNQSWTMQDHVIQTPVVSGWIGQGGGQMAQSVGHATNFPQVYSDHYPSQSTVTNASILAVPGGYAAAVRRQNQ